MDLRHIDIDIPVPGDFDLWRTVRGSGWSGLAPFSLDEEDRTLSRVHGLSSGKIVRTKASQTRGDVLTVSIESEDEPDESDIEEIESLMATCLRLDEDLSPFYAMLGGIRGSAG